ncbi:MAG: exodeoxyribonuclease VII large subunit [Spirochaetaceae bacterium]|nr:exodeoxyribonuclease VII large subunit [Spirochaetaceae bacterium]
MSDFFPDNNVFSVSQITELIKTVIENNFSSVTIEGEISNFRPSSTGHWYFTLKDSNAAISAVMFKGKSRSLSFIPKDGMSVKASGSLSVYPQRGTYQIIIDRMELAGTGDILKLLEERKQKLAAEGLFDESKKKKLPFFPLTVGVVTSPTGAALQDILNITGRRNNSVSVIILPCSVQGAEAAESICQQIETANRYKLADVLIVGRGGGSLEDLLPFSEENVVRAVAASKIPIVSAVGHEIDFSLSDFAADVRAPTPSAAAELVTPLKTDIEDEIMRNKQVLITEIQSKLERCKLLVKSFSPESMELRFRSIQLPLLQRFDSAKEDLLKATQEKITQQRNKLMLAVQKLEQLNPQAVLQRGYSLVRLKQNGTILKSAKDANPGDIIEIIPAQGKLEAQITEIKPNTEK